MSCKLARATGVSLLCACVDSVKMASKWKELIRRVWADRITDKLFSREIISAMDKEEIESKAVRNRRKGAKLLLEIMLRRSWEKCVEFAVIVSETEGVKDLGEKLLENAGEKWITVQCDFAVSGGGGG